MKFHNPFNSSNFSVVYIAFVLVVAAIVALFFAAPMFTGFALLGCMVGRVLYYIVKGN